MHGVCEVGHLATEGKLELAQPKQQSEKQASADGACFVLGGMHRSIFYCYNIFSNPSRLFQLNSNATMIKPKKLHKGDKVAVVSPSNSISYRRDLFDRAKAVLEVELGIEIVASPNCFVKHYYSAGTVSPRLARLGRGSLSPSKISRAGILPALFIAGEHREPKMCCYGWVF